MTGKTFRFYATINEVHDGDTLYGWVDQGIGQWNHGAARNGIGTGVRPVPDWPRA